MWHHPDEYVKLNKEKSMKKGEPGMPSGVPAQLPKIPASLRDELHKLHARWLTKKKRPLSVVEDKEYRDIWRKALNGTYTPPDHTTLRGFILELSNEGQQRVATVNETLRRDHLKPSIAGDIWSSANHSISLLGITQYHINNNWEIEELLVAAEPFSRESHTGDAITEKTHLCLQRMNYPADIYSGVFKKTSDNGSNVVKGWKGFTGGECVDHTAQLSLGAFIEHEGIAQTVKKMKGMTTHFHQSTGVDGLAGLTKCQKELGLPIRHPVQGCATRWSSWGEMMEFYRLEQRAVQLYDVRHSRKAGVAYRENQMGLKDWQVNEQACAIVQMVNDWVQLMEGTRSYPTMPLVLPTIYTLINELQPSASLKCCFAGEDPYQLQPHEIDKDVLSARDTLHSDLVSRFITNIDQTSKRQYAIAALLHPCFKEYTFPGASDEERRWALVELNTEWRHHWKNINKQANRPGTSKDSEGNTIFEDRATSKERSPATRKSPAAKRKSPTRIGDEILVDDAAASPKPSIRKKRSVSLASLMGNSMLRKSPDARAAEPELDQLQQYFNEPSVKDLNIDVLLYWRAKEHVWPDVARMVRQYFAAPASSAGVERVFSAAGRFHDDLRKAMKEGTLKHALFASVNTN